MSTKRSAEAVDKDSLRDEHTGIESTDRLQADEALIVDVFDQKADLVDMRRDHHLGTAIAVFHADNIAHNVD
jgi:hypothetical protein